VQGQQWAVLQNRHGVGEEAEVEGVAAGP